MRRAPITTALVAAALAAATSAPAAAPPPVPVSVKIVSCSVDEHEAAFHARMKLVDGASRMAMRFTLLQQTAPGHAERLDAPGLRRWHRSKPGVRSFGYRQGFRKLPENAAYRVRVDFRWHASDGEEVLREHRRSAPCRQFTSLPNLTARIARIAPTVVPGVVRYEAAVTNLGKAGATDVPLRLTVDGDVVDTVTIPAIEPGEERTVAIRGPQCRRLAKLEADPEQAIAETSDDDNAHELPCASS